MDFPVFLRLTGKLCVVVGSGPVGRRKAHALLHAGATVRIVSPDAPWTDHAGSVEWIQTEYRPIHTNGAFLVCASATPEVNRRVVADAKAARIFVNSATEPETGDFTIPAVSTHGPIQVAVSTSGASPMLARRLVGFLGEKVDQSWIEWVNCLAELRPIIRTEIANIERRNELFTELCDPRWLAMIESEGLGTTQEQMQELVKSYASE